MADITTTTTLQEHRERIGRLLVSDLDFGFGQTAWWKGTFLEDEAYPAIEDMFNLPTPPPSPQPSPSPVAPSSPTESISNSVVELASYINQMPKKKDGLPSRNKLRKDNRLKGEVSRKTGCLRVQKRGSKLRRFVGDGRLFSEDMWSWLCGDQSEEEEEEIDDQQLAIQLQREERGLRVRK